MTAGARILVVDDNEDNLYTLTERLKREGYVDLVTAGDGAAALDRLAGEPFDLVLLDVMMPFSTVSTHWPGSRPTRSCATSR